MTKTVSQSVRGGVPAADSEAQRGVTTKRARVLLADDHPVVLEGLKSIIEREFEIVGTVTDGRALLAKAESWRPDVIVADISMPNLNGIDAAVQLRERHCNAKIIFLTIHTDLTFVARALESGADGYVLKHSLGSELINAIREVLQGRLYLSPQISSEELKRFGTSHDTIRKKTTELTPRQREILQLLAEGKLAKEIGGILRISTRTVEFHKYKMMDKLQVTRAAELVHYAIKHGLISCDTTPEKS